MAQGTIFPAIIKLEHRDDGSAKASFLAEVGTLMEEGTRRARVGSEAIGKEIDRAFAKPGGGAFLGGLEAVLGNARGEITRFNVDARRLLDQAVSGPRTAGGALNLNASGIRDAAAAQQARATAARELATATEIAARAEGQLDSATQRAVAGLRAEAAQQEQAAAATRAHADAVARIQGVLERQATATAAPIAANRRLAASNDNTRYGLQNLSFQFQDVAVQLAGGTSAARVFAQQGPQIVGAIQQMSGGASKFALFMGGPWGAAIGVGVAALGFLATKLFETDDAAKKAKDAALDLSSGLDRQRASHEALTKAIDDYNRSQGKAIQQGRLYELQARASAQADLNRALATRQALAAQLAGGLRGQFGTIGAILDAGQTVATYDENARKYQENQQSIARLQTEINNRALQLGEYAGKALDPLEKIRQRYEDINRVIAKGSAGGLYKGVPVEQVLAEVARRRQGEQDAANAAKRASRPRAIGSEGSAVRTDQGAALATSAERYRGAGEGSATLSDLFSRAGIHVDPRMTAWCAAFVNAVLATNAIAGTGSLSARSFLGFGESTNSPVRGDIVVSRRGGPGQGHVGFYEGRDAAGNVSVLGGNTANKVGIERVAARDVLGFRRAPTAAESYADEARSLDAATKAATEYVATLTKEREQVGLTAQQLRQLEVARHAAEAPTAALKAQIEQAGALRELALVAHDAQQVFGDGLANAFDSAATAAAGFFGQIATGALERQAAAARQLLEQLDALAPVVGRLGGAGRTLGSLGQIASGLQSGNFSGLTGAGPAGAALQILSQSDNGKALIGELETRLDRIFGGAGSFTKLMKGALQSAGLGIAAGQTVLGSRGSGLGGALGGALGNEAGKAIGKSIGGLLGKAGGPIGSIVGGVLGSALGGLFKGATKKGVSTIGIGANGALQIASTTGNSGDRKTATIGAATEALSTVQRIADSLGATVNASLGSVSIGVRKDSYKVDPTGQGRTKGSGVLDFGKDSAAAIKAATLDLIKDGVLTGLRQGTQTLLQGAKDLETGLQRAVDFNSIFDRLKAFNDPVGAALDSLDREFGRLKGIVGEAGQGLVELETLYGKERANAVKSAMEQVTGSLKGLLSDLGVGNDALSLTDRRAAALAAYDPLKARLASGDVTASDDYAGAARQLLDIQRQISGSQGGYFDLLDQVTGLSRSTLDKQTALADASASRDSPFSSAPVVNSIASQTDILGTKLDALNENVGTLIQQNGALLAAGGSSAFDFSAFW